VRHRRTDSAGYSRAGCGKDVGRPDQAVADQLRVADGREKTRCGTTGEVEAEQPIRACMLELARLVQAAYGTDDAQVRYSQYKGKLPEKLHEMILAEKGDVNWEAAIEQFETYARMKPDWLETGVATTAPVATIAPVAAAVTPGRAGCYRCGQPGHLQRDCPAAQKQCYKCGSTQHLPRNCPGVAQQQQQTTTTRGRLRMARRARTKGPTAAAITPTATPTPPDQDKVLQGLTEALAQALETLAEKKVTQESEDDSSYVGAVTSNERAAKNERRTAQRKSLNAAKREAAEKSHRKLGMTAGQWLATLLGANKAARKKMLLDEVGDDGFDLETRDPLVMAATGTARFRQATAEVGYNGGPTRPTIIDSGACVNLMSRSEFRNLGKKSKLSPCEEGEGDVGTAKTGGRIKVLGHAVVDVTVGGKSAETVFLVTEELALRSLLGVPALKALGLIIDFRNELLWWGTGTEQHVPLIIEQHRHVVAARLYQDVVVQPGRHEMLEAAVPFNGKMGKNAMLLVEDVDQTHSSTLRVRTGAVQVENCRVKLHVSNEGSRPLMLKAGMVLALGEEVDQIGVSSKDCTIGRERTPEERNAIEKILSKFSDVLVDDLELGGAARVSETTIDTGDARPKKVPERRLSQPERKALQEIVDKLLRNKVIRKSKSPWSAPVVLVRKKDGTYRLCVDYRQLNSVTRLDAYPLPRIDETIEKLQGARYFTLMDLASGYWQIPLNEASKAKTAFQANGQLFESNVLPMGICNAPPEFQRIMSELFSEMLGHGVLLYIDDLIIYSKTWEEHVKKLEKVLTVMKEVNLKAKRAKCRFAMSEITYLGFRVSKDGVQPDDEKICKIRDTPAPRDAKELRGFLGLAGFYRMFIENFSAIAKPLNTLLRLGVDWSWGKEQQEAFEKLKKAVTSRPVLAYPDFTRDFELWTDASQNGIGAMLAQRDEKGKHHAIRYLSRSLKPNEVHYGIPELECLAAVWATAQLRPYLEGRPFTIVTDHYGLKWLPEKKEDLLTSRMHRWSIAISRFKYNVVYRKGEKNPADFASRTAARVAAKLEEAERKKKSGKKKGKEPARTQDDEEVGEEEQVTPPVPDVVPELRSLDEQIREEQDRDEVIQAAIEFIKTRKIPNNRNLWHGVRLLAQDCELKDGRLVSPFRQADKETKYRMVVPLALRQDVMTEIHEGTGGHFGTDTTYDALRQRFYWFGMWADVNRFVRSCRVCAERRKPGGVPQGFAAKQPRMGEPYFAVGMDCLKMPVTKRGNCEVFVVTDLATKEAWTFAVENEKAETLAGKLMEMMAHTGCFQQVWHDRGASFMGKVIETLGMWMQTKSERTSGFHPQTNGQTERLNRTLCDMLSKYGQNAAEDWDLYLPVVAMAYNSKVHDATGESPFYLLHGLEMRKPIDVSLALPQRLSTMQEYLNNLCRHQQWAERIMTERSAEAADRYAQRHDQDHREPSFKRGDLVMELQPQLTSSRTRKTNRPYTGPFAIAEVLEHNTVRLADPVTGRRLPKVVNIARLTKTAALRD